MLGRTPESAAVQALNTNVGQLLSYLDTGAWRKATADALALEMQSRLRIMLTDNLPRNLSSITAREEGLGGNAGPHANMQEEARILSQPLVQVLITKLELLNVPPLEEDIVVRELLGSVTALGVQMVASGYRPALAILRQMGSACSATSALLAFQSALCVEDGNIKSAWFEAIFW